MDELVALASNITVNTNIYDTSCAHPRFAQYKTRGKMPSQVDRRKKFLESLKQRRHDYVNHARHLAEDTLSASSEDSEEEMDCSAPQKRPSRSYRKQLMLSEWLVEVPSDLKDEWLLILCPVGKRCLVIASKGETRVYSRGGYRVNRFPSHLPGGSHKQNSGSSGYTILDCIFNIEKKIYYILDVMCWKGHPVYDSETEFRFYWLHCKTEEVPEIRKKSSANPYRFLPLPYYSCSHESIEMALSSPLPFNCQLDGLLFYHKRTPYTAGVTPLVGWLKAYMVPELLNISVSDDLCKDRPESYTSMKNHLSVAIAKQEKRKQERESSQNMANENEEEMAT